MPDRFAGRPSGLTQAAISEVAKYLADFTESARVLSARELDSYGWRRWVAGWRLRVEFPDRSRELDLLIRDGFPLELPRVALVDPPEFLTWSHVERDGLLCLLNSGATANVKVPVEIVHHVLKLACELVEELAAGEHVDDFRDEFESYWDQSSDPSAPTVYSIATPGPPSRSVALWTGQEFYLVADNANQAKEWLIQRSGKSRSRDFESKEALWLWTERPLLPSEYPQTAADVLALADRDPAAGKILRSLAANEQLQIVVGLGSATAHGPGLGSIIIPQLPLHTDRKRHSGRGNRTKAKTDGFRRRVPLDVLEARAFNKTKVVRAPLSRADAPWIHGRGADDNFCRLSGLRIGILGCGSVGGAVAVSLAQAGIGNLVLIDPDALAWENTSRHPLGANSVGLNKARALAEHLRFRFPYLRAAHHNLSWQKIAIEASETLESCDVIVSAMGSWSAESALNAWHLEQSRVRPIVYGWTEAHACAGHAVAIAPDGGCFTCGFSELGRADLQVVEWPAGNPARQIPACAGTFQPYGAVELGFVNALIAELAIDCALQKVAASTHRIWAARLPRLKECGGVWSEKWLSIVGERTAGGIVEERPWLTSPQCFMCQRSA